MAILVPGSWISSSEGSPSRAAPSVAGPYLEKDIGEHGEHGPYTPAGLREAYGLPSESAGTGQTVGIVDAFDDPNAESDLAKYRSHFGLPPCTAANGCFRKVNQSGGSTYPATNAQWAVEISLDLDMVSAVCPNCHILLVEATSNGDIELGEAEDEAVALGATELSDSWGGREFFYEAEYNSYFNHPGVPIAVAAGDEGNVVTYPAATPTVISVGGTDLERAKNARGWTETVWGGEGKGGTGSGCSAYEAKPAWQTDTSCTKRTDNDVAAVAGTSTPVWVADSFEDSHQTYPVEDPGWTLGSGTSTSAPIVAATMALASTSTRSLPGAEAFYEEATQHSDGALNDVLTGNNGTCATYLCEAGPGYDGPTGLGSPDGPPVVLPAVQQEPQGSWVGKVGSAGYLLAGWSGAQDASDLPGVTANLVQGSRWRWAQNSSDARALQGPEGTTRNAATYYDANEIKLNLSFSTAYSGNLHLYADDWDSQGRRETVSVNGQPMALTSSFTQGAWLTFPISVAAGGTVSITVARTAGANAVLSGIFLGEAGPPPAVKVESAPQGSWVNAVGSAGYALAGLQRSKWRPLLHAQRDPHPHPGEPLAVDWRHLRPTRAERSGRAHTQRRHLLRPERNPDEAELQRSVRRKPASLRPGLGLGGPAGDHLRQRPERCPLKRLQPGRVGVLPDQRRRRGTVTITVDPTGRRQRRPVRPLPGGRGRSARPDRDERSAGQMGRRRRLGRLCPHRLERNQRRSLLPPRRDA